jgi:NAD(P)H-dependent flavin oxidoreductase YrpB (nitropropane dioxygenase family)
MIKTKVTEALGIKTPIFQAGMGPFGTNNLCIASSNAGALGLVSSTGLFAHLIAPELGEVFRISTGVTEEEMENPREVLKTMCRYALNETKETKGIFGMNCMVSEELGGTLEDFFGAAQECREEDSEMEKRFKVLVTSAGNPAPVPDVGGGIVKRMQDSGMLWFHVVPHVRAAARCLKTGCDGIIASGHEGGYHTAWDPVHSMTLLPAVTDYVFKEEKREDVIVLGAGGFCDGKGLAAALALGADGIQMGTRMLSTKESDFVDLWKELVAKEPDRASIVARGIVGPARYMKTPQSLRLAEETSRKEPNLYIGRADDLFSVPPELLTAEMEGIAATYAGDEEHMLAAGGECAQRITDMPTVKELVERIMKEAEEIIRDFPKNFIVQ